MCRYSSSSQASMNLYSYFKPTNGLPDPRGSLSSDIQVTPEATVIQKKIHSWKISILQYKYENILNEYYSITKNLKYEF